MAPVLALLLGAGACSETPGDGDSPSDADADAGIHTGGNDTRTDGSCEYSCQEHCTSEGGIEHAGTCDSASFKCCEIDGAGGRQNSGGSGNGGNISAGGGPPNGSGGRPDEGSSGGDSSSGGGSVNVNGGAGGGSGENSGGETGEGSGGAASDKPPGTHVRDPNLPTYPFSDPTARYPFPQQVTYDHGVLSTAIDHEHVANWYESWKGRYLQSCNGVMPGTSPSSTSKVEAQGFAMITAAYMADKATFDGLYSFYTSKLQANSCGLMAWQTNCGGVVDAGAATDGDIDVASGLIVAHWQWPNDGYDEKALGVITNLEAMVADCDGLKAVIPGCSGGRTWGGCNETDVSYYSPAFFRYFAELSGNDMWTQLADDTHTIRDAAANGQTGLVPDWQTVGGQAGAGGRAGHYGFDAIRTPFKHALDYLWNGNEAAGAWCDKITGWADGVGINRIVDSYQLNGSAAGSNHNLAVVGSLAVCALATTQERADSFVAESVKLRDDYWYSGYLGNLYLLAMSGNMWNIDMMAPVDP